MSIGMGRRCHHKPECCVDVLNPSLLGLLGISFLTENIDAPIHRYLLVGTINHNLSTHVLEYCHVYIDEVVNIAFIRCVLGLNEF